MVDLCGQDLSRSSIREMYRWQKSKIGDSEPLLFCLVFFVQTMVTAAGRMIR